MDSEHCISTIGNNVLSYTLSITFLSWLYRRSIHPKIELAQRTRCEWQLGSDAVLAPGATIDRTSCHVYSGVVADYNSTDIFVEMPNGQLIPADDTASLDQAVKDSLTLVNGTVSPDSANDADALLLCTDVPTWSITASDVDQSLTTYDLETQREPQQGVINIIGLSQQYILGQLGSNQTRNNTLMQNSTVSSRIRRNQSLNMRAVDGSVQCGPGQPCLDGSCCNTDGKCGFKGNNCGAKCIPNCDAKAMCGIDSADGITHADVHCNDPEPQLAKTPCQVGYGSCEIKPSPSCGKSSGTTRGRRVGYYQGWNTRERQCDKVAPRQINTRGLTHLFYSFAFFHPTTFELMPMNEGDIPLYGEFTSLKRNELQTWIAIGGWSFNDPGTATYSAYSDMVSTQANRAAFINSLIKFMDTYGFQGADIDWEYPAESKRGGRKADTDNLVLLMREMHAAFAGRYGSRFKPAEMQDYVDFLGFMRQVHIFSMRKI
ncbi:glycoside hydrolase [Setomelanomma holmii]|uniref:chitinase n=1 Tax=Setomelanomma holmii TaxID=210430 RepID=A0A9P4GZE7_9PLEO|nr:glycoside hydrolase [Setomelanomma holmii]